MKNFISILIYLSTWSGLTQVIFEKAPENAKVIYFVYEKKSNYLVNDEGIFADTLLLKIDFPNLRYTLRKHPLDSSVICGFSTVKKFGNNNRKKLVSILYHTNETIHGTHLIPSRKTVFKVVRGDEETRNIFKNYFNKRFHNFEYREEFDFLNKINKVEYPTVSYTLAFSEISSKINYSSEKMIGNYYEMKNGFLCRNLVFLNSGLSKFVSPLLFENLEFGIEKLETIDKTIVLKSVYYK
jgi:hypothetical protein